MVKLAIQSRLVPGSSLREKHGNALRYGFDGMELSHFPMIEAAEEAVRTGSRQRDVSGHRGWLIDPDPKRSGVPRGRQAAPRAGGGARRPVDRGADLRPHEQAAELRTGRSPEEDERLWLAGLREVTDHAEGRGHHRRRGINRYENSYRSRSPMRPLGSGDVELKRASDGDVFHMNIEEPDMGAAGRSRGDARLCPPRRFPAIRTRRGHLDFASVFDGLRRIGYDGWASMECNLSGDPELELPPASPSCEDTSSARRGEPRATACGPPGGVARSDRAWRDRR